MRFTAAADDHQRRLDRVLRKALPGMPLSALHRLFRKGKITLDGRAAAPSARVLAGQSITIPGRDRDCSGPLLSPPSRQASCLPPAAVIFENSDVLVLNKAPGIAVHGPDSLEGQVRTYLEPKTPRSLSFRPGPLHRLDKPTSGIIVFSVSLRGARFFSSLFREGGIRKEYLAVADGTLDARETWEDSLIRDTGRRKTFSGEKAPGGNNGEYGPKTALTKIRPLAQAGGRTLLLAEIATGRTHQIRAQAAARGHPLSGDRKYGGKPFPESGRQGPGAFFLHALALEIPGAPRGAGIPRRMEAPLPEDYARMLKTIFRYHNFG
jgi:23S rRNA pseudouridine955/2504/2580 synthase